MLNRLNRSGLLKIRTDERVRAEIFNTFLNVGYLLYKIGNLRRKVDFSWTINILMKQWDRTNVCKLRRFGDLEKTYYCTFGSQTLAAKVWTCQSLNATQLPVRTLARSNFGTIAKLPKLISYGTIALCNNVCISILYSLLFHYSNKEHNLNFVLFLSGSLSRKLIAVRLLNTSETYSVLLGPN